MFRLSLIIITILGIAFAQHPCAGYPSAVSTLEACSTRSAFCSQYLHSSVSFTRTRTEITTRVVPHTTRTTTTVSNTVTATSYTATTTIDGGTVVVTSTSTITVTPDQPYATSCPSSNEKRHWNDKRARIPSSATICGLAPTLAPAAISGACNCLLAASTTTTVTIISTSSFTVTARKTAKASTITTIDSVTTTFTSTQTPTTTITACTQFTTFALQLANTGTTYDGQYVHLDFDGPDNESNEQYHIGFIPGVTSASTFTFDSTTQRLMSVGDSGETVVGQLYQQSNPSASTPNFLVPADVGQDPYLLSYYLSCSVPYPSLITQCVANGQDTYYLETTDGGSTYIFLGNSGDVDPQYFDNPPVPATLVAVPLDV